MKYIRQAQYRFKSTSLLLLVVMLAAGLVVGCSKGDDNEEQTPRPHVHDVGLDLKIGGWSVGSNPNSSDVFSDGDSLVIFATKTDNSRCILVYSSPRWGAATLLNVKIEQNDTAYLFSKPVTSTLRADRSAWDFSAPVDTFYMFIYHDSDNAMVTVESCPAVLASGYMTIEEPHRWQFDFDAYLDPEKALVQRVSFRSGKIPAEN